MLKQVDNLIAENLHVSYVQGLPLWNPIEGLYSFIFNTSKLFSSLEVRYFNICIWTV